MKIKKLILVLVLLCPSWLGAQISAVLGVATYQFKSCVIPGGVVSGQPLIVSAGTRAGTITGINDTVLSAWTPIDSITGTTTVKDWIGVAGGTGADTVTITGVGDDTDVVQCLKLNPNLYSSTIDVHTAAAGPGTDPWTANPLTPTVNRDFYYVYDEGASFLSNASGRLPMQWLSSLTVGNNGSSAYKIAGQSGIAVNATFDDTNSTQDYVEFLLKPNGLVIVPSSLPTGALSKSYFYTLTAIGGSGPYTWSVSGGSLPLGLTLNSVGTINGTPTGGTSTFTAQVTDGVLTTTKSFTLTVNSIVNTISLIQATASAEPQNLASVASGDVITVTCPAVNTTSLSEGEPISPPIDSLSTIYSYVGSVSANPHDGNIAQVFYIGTATNSGADAITTPASGVVCLATQYRGAQGIADIDVFTQGHTTGVTLTSNSITTPTTGAVVVSTCESSNTSGVHFTAVPPFTLDANDIEQAEEHRIETAIISETPQFTSSGTLTGWIMNAFALRPSTSVPVPPPVSKIRHLVVEE